MTTVYLLFRTKKSAGWLRAALRIGILFLFVAQSAYIVALGYALGQFQHSAVT